MADIIILIILAAAVGAAIRYIRKSRKSGAKCIGCPSSGTCSKCTCHEEK